MERLTSRDSRTARAFANILSRAPVVPLALSAPAAIVLEQAHFGVANAQGGCVVKVELQPILSQKNPNKLEQTFPCAKRVDIGIDAQQDYLITAEVGSRIDWRALLGYGGAGTVLGLSLGALLAPLRRST